MEFFYSEAPAGMRSLATAFSWTSLALGYFLSSVLVKIVNRATHMTKTHGWLGGNNLNRNHLNLFYWLLAILSMINFVIYLYWSKWYKYKPKVRGQVTDEASTTHLTEYMSSFIASWSMVCRTLSSMGSPWQSQAST